MNARKLNPVANSDDFLANPLGRYFVDTRIVAWCATPTLCGFTFWGSATAVEVRRLARPIELPKPANIAAKINVLVNVRRVESVDLTTFDELLTSMRQRTPAYAQRVERMALVRPQGLIGALAEGIGNLVLPLHGWKVVDSQATALEWLGADTLRETVDAVERIANDALGESPVLMPLRRWLVTQEGQASLDAAARALGQSRRSLQRTLASADTSFKDELHRELLLRAQRYLRETDDKLDAIAQRLGFAGISSFGAFYRRMTGESPGEARGPSR